MNYKKKITTLHSDTVSFGLLLNLRAELKDTTFVSFPNQLHSD